MSRGHLAALALVVAGPLAFLYPLTHPANKVPVPNNKHLDPAVVTPGVRVKYRIQGLNVYGVDGMTYRGQPVVRVLNARQLGCPEKLEATGSDRQWDQTLTVHKDSKNERMEPQIEIVIPQDPALDGQTLQLGVTMDMLYAGLHWGMAGSATFSDHRVAVSDTLVVEMAPPEYTRDLRRALHVALGVAGVSLLGALWLTVLVPAKSTAEVILADSGGENS